MSSVEHFATVTWDELGSPTTPALISISGWGDNNIGLLNISIDECFVTASGDFSPAFYPSVSGIYKEMYKVKYYESQIKDAVNNVAVKGTGSALDWVELKEGDSVIRRANPAEMARLYRGLKSDAEVSLRSMIFSYKANEGKPEQVVGEEWESNY